MPEQNNLSQPVKGAEQNSSPSSHSRVRRFLGKLGLGSPRNHMPAAQQEYPRPINLQPKGDVRKMPEVQRDLPAFAVIGQNPKTGAAEFYSQPSTTSQTAQGEQLSWKTNGGVIGAQPEREQDHALPYTFSTPKPPRQADFNSPNGMYNADPNAQPAQFVPGSENHGDTPHPMPPSGGVSH
jgi:hypothetical protein